ncbi:hypothetical protein [Sinorhizobium meliloti]|nr:hypothetical protein U8C30_24505 [Sinorhizobium meliloti]
MAYENMYLPDWINAANVCDQNVTNRSGGTEEALSRRLLVPRQQ